MKKVFRPMALIAILLMGISSIPGACTPVRQTPVPPMPTPVVFTTSDLTTEPGRLRPGSNAMIGVTVTNTGEQPGTYTVVLKVDGAIAETRDVTLAGGASQRVNFLFNTYEDSTERDYVVTIDQLKGILQVKVGL